MSILVVPEEVLLHHILPLLDLTSLRSCLLTCRIFHSLISSSVLLTYLRELELAGLVNNPHVSFALVSLNERLKLLREREERWSRPDCKWKKRSTLEPLSDVDQLLPHRGGVKAIHYRDFQTKRVAFGMPSNTKEGSIDWGCGWIEFGGRGITTIDSAIPEYGLLACILDVPFGHPQEVNLLSHTTLKPHPLATHPVIEIPSIPERVLRVTELELLGGILLVWATCSAEGTSPREPNWIGIFDWKTGEMKAEIEAPPRILLLKLVFLRENLVLLPCVDSLEIFMLPSNLVQDRKNIPAVCSFELPRADFREARYPSQTCITDLFCAPSPLCQLARNSEDTVFAVDTTKSILCFCVDSVEESEDSDGEHLDFYYLITHIQSLLHFIDSGNLSTSRTIPWAEWKMFTFSFHELITERVSVWGQRMLIVDEESRRGRILNFNRNKIHSRPPSSDADADVDELTSFLQRTEALVRYPFTRYCDEPPAPSIPVHISPATALDVGSSLDFDLTQDSILTFPEAGDSIEPGWIEVSYFG